MARKYPIGIQTFSELSSHTPTRAHGWTFSTINNLKNITMLPQFSAICGITEHEVKTVLAEAATAERLRVGEHSSGMGFYEYTLYLIFSMLNIYVRTQVKCAGGRVDMVVWMPDTVYVFELKVNGTAQEALQQIDGKSYAIPYQTDGRPVVKVGVKFDAEKRVPEEWVIE